MLRLHVISLPFEIMCDVLNYAVEADIGQCIDKKATAIFYASKMLVDAELHYMTTEKELLGVIFALEKFRPYVLGRNIIVYNNRAALKYLLSKKEAKLQIIRWVLLLKEFDFEIKDKKGSENSVANHISRLQNTTSREISDTFSDEKLLTVVTKAPWFVHIVKYLLMKSVPIIGTQIKSEDYSMIFDNTFGKNPTYST